MSLPSGVKAVNLKKSPIIDSELSDYLLNRDLNLSASTDLTTSVVDADFVIVSTPTNMMKRPIFLILLQLKPSFQR